MVLGPGNLIMRYSARSPPPLSWLDALATPFSFLPSHCLAVGRFPRRRASRSGGRPRLYVARGTSALGRDVRERGYASTG